MKRLFGLCLVITLFCGIGCSMVYAFGDEHIGDLKPFLDYKNNYTSYDGSSDSHWFSYYVAYQKSKNQSGTGDAAAQQPTADSGSTYIAQQPTADSGSTYIAQQPTADSGSTYIAKQPTADSGSTYIAKQPTADSGSTYIAQQPTADPESTYVAGQYNNALPDIDYYQPQVDGIGSRAPEFKKSLFDDR